MSSQETGSSPDSARPTAAEPATGSGTEPVVTAETVAAYDIRPGPSVAATDSAAAGPAEADAVSAARNESAPGAAAPRGNTPDPAAGRLFNRDDPTGWANLVGRRISVRWLANKRQRHLRQYEWYQGKIDQFDPQKMMHHVTYDDNDQKWYNLTKKTFRIVGEGYEYNFEDLARQTTDAQNNRRNQYGANNGYNYYQQRGFQQYVSRDPSARTKTTFHVVIDPRNIDTGSEVVCMNGGLEVLGKWDNTTGCPLSMDPANPFIWRGEVELPFLAHEFCPQGIFEFKCGLLKNTGHKVEKGRRRRTKQMQSHYFLSTHPFELPFHTCYVQDHPNTIEIEAVVRIRHY